MRTWLSSVWQRWRIKRYRDRQSVDARTDRDAAEHIDRLEHGIGDAPRGAGPLG